MRRVRGGPVAGTDTEVVSVPAGGEGGVYQQVAVAPRTAYTESAFLEVPALSRGAEADFVLEWYGPDLSLLGYQTHRINVTSGRFSRRVQSVRSPRDTAWARVVVNLRGGGRVEVDAPQLEAGSRVSPFSPGRGAPTGPASAAPAPSS